MSTSITLRPYLVGQLNDLVESADLGVLGKCSLVCELVSLFADYKEEGASLFLDAFLTHDLKKLRAMIPNNSYLRLGTTTCDEAGIRVAVKKTAPLVRGSWKMYLSLDNKKLEYGLFRDSGHPLNVPIDIALQGGGSGDVRFIRVTKLAESIVGTTTHEGKQVIIQFTNAKEGVLSEGNHFCNLCKIVCENLDEKRSQSCNTYIASLLSKAVRESHGSLIAVVAPGKFPAILKDCTRLNPPINISEAVESVKRNSDAIPDLESVESLVCGMFCCDGIVVFDTKARVLAYNAFVTPKASNVDGGARKRAYKALCDVVGKKVVAAFYQSQDGASDLRRMC